MRNIAVCAAHHSTTARWKWTYWLALGLIGYIRVSRIGGRSGEGYISPDVQRSAIEGYASELGQEILRFADDQDYSGGNTDRPAFREAMASLEAGEADGIVVEGLDHDGLRDALSGMVQAIFVRRGRRAPVSERVLVVWRNEPPVEVPGRRRDRALEPIRW